jgi:hypothetical protein
MKALVAENDDRILGFAMIGAEAGEVLAAVHVAMLADLSYSALADADFAHPTMAEGLSSLFSHRLIGLGIEKPMRPPEWPADAHGDRR